MTQEEQPIQHLSEPGDVVEAWEDLILYVDEKGIIQHVEGQALRYLPDSATPGIPFWSALVLKTRSLRETLKHFPSLQIHEISCCEGRSFLIRIIPLRGRVENACGYVVVVTDNRPMEVLYETYEERLVDNISAWSDSITLFNAMFDTAKDATFLIDESGIILSANTAALEQHGADDKGFSGKDFTILVGRKFHVPLRQAMQSLQSRQIWNEKIAAIDAEGESFPSEAILRKIEFTDYSLFQLILHDLSPQMELRDDLRDQKAEVEKMNIALRQVIRTVEEERQELRDHLTSQMKKQMLPALERIAKSDTAEIREGYRNVIEEQLAGLAGNASGDLDPELLRLSPREMEVCQLIQLGKSGKEMAELLSMSFETVQTHRKNIRRKLGLRGKKTSLFAYLREKPSLT